MLALPEYWPALTRLTVSPLGASMRNTISLWYELDVSGAEQVPSVFVNVMPMLTSVIEHPSGNVEAPTTGGS